jgi:replication factor C large subunit
MPWSEKYRPQTLQDIIITDDLYTKIYSWIEKWNAGRPRNKGLILYGPPGTGKSSTAYCIARSFGIPVIEMNGSSQRNSEKMREIAGNAAMTRDIFSNYSEPDKKPDKIILIDEADNIDAGRSGTDSGGIRELGSIIRNTACPIILTMNDFYEFRRKNGADTVISGSDAIEFKQYARRNDNNSKKFRLKLLNRVREILAKEGKSLGPEILNEIFERDGTDIRAILNDIEAATSNISATMSGNRDEPGNIFKTLESILINRDPAKSISALTDKDFTVDQLLLWIDENLADVADNPGDLASSYENIAIADLFNGFVNKKQHFAFQGYAQEIAALSGSTLENSSKHFLKFQFPVYLSRMSAVRDSREARKSVHMKLARFNHSSTETISAYEWFFRLLAQYSGQEFASLASRLMLSEAEARIIGGK